MSKTKKSRQQAQEVERTLKLIEDGLKEFQSTWQDFEGDHSSKLEQQLRQQLQKLQKLRSQVRAWYEEQQLKEYHQRLLNARQLIEAEMSRFKVSEKNMRKGRDDDDDDGTYDEALVWIKRCITNITVEINRLEGNSENKKQKKFKEHQASVYKEHLSKFEQIRQGLEEHLLRPDDIELVKEQLDEFIEEIRDQYTELDFDVYEPLIEIIESGGHQSDSEGFGGIDIQVDDRPQQQPTTDATTPTPRAVSPEQKASSEPPQDKIAPAQPPQAPQTPPYLSTQSSGATQQVKKSTFQLYNSQKQPQTRWSFNNTKNQFQTHSLQQQAQKPHAPAVQIHRFGSTAQSSQALQHRCQVNYDQLDLVQFDALFNRQCCTVPAGQTAHFGQQLQLTDVKCGPDRHQVVQSGYLYQAPPDTNPQLSLEASYRVLAAFSKYYLNADSDTGRWTPDAGHIVFTSSCFSSQGGQRQAEQFNDRIRKAMQQYQDAKYQPEMQLRAQSCIASTTRTQFIKEVEIVDQLPAETKLYLFYHRQADQVQILCYISLQKQGWVWNEKLERFFNGDIFYDPYTGQMVQIERL